MILYQCRNIGTVQVSSMININVKADNRLETVRVLYIDSRCICLPKVLVLVIPNGSARSRSGNLEIEEAITFNST